MAVYSVMGNYHYIPKAQKQLILTMSLRGMKPAQIEQATGIGERAIYRIKCNWKSTGSPVRESLESLYTHWCQGRWQEHRL
ncbi:hypothetical protein BYT27DRAFT_7180762 [Phlegmacium glaucopus]|nr:hypothetical protein BYT27DRAFT_7202726 [Phlegmacium glaucopus]KAF8799867.1 hypothetical protein BYT27DRAFT_7200844 [Phlegmacium glaucopus]KAF8804670.1 hypothetical protein BYT27DRAFT_7194283 [Phlegmacium glaucopus]KAF8804979.1 hypothetical protein BYT27DRAFT_7193693 [Phlegmacium glaucopus]KAF8813966.1 hypothetical protein BYT27DRAFT_7180762 [Phlegmacium glaucopus]